MHATGQQAPTRKTRPWLRRGLMAAAAMVLVGVITLWLMAQHKPNWYRPPVADEAVVRRARREVTVLLDNISDKMVLAESIEVVITEQEVNEWLAALPRLWPDATGAIPASFGAWAVSFEETGLRVGVHYADGVWEAILNLHVAATVTSDGRSIEVSLLDARSGSLPLPHAIIDSLLGYLPSVHGVEVVGVDGASAGLKNPDAAGDPLIGVRIQNRFVWPNGDRAFRVDTIRLEEGQLVFRLQPL